MHGCQAANRSLAPSRQDLPGQSKRRGVFALLELVLLRLLPFPSLSAAQRQSLEPTCIYVRDLSDGGWLDPAAVWCGVCSSGNTWGVGKGRHKRLQIRLPTYSSTCLAHGSSETLKMQHEGM
ncbi:unnamed protein product [[Candida] boidinii]|uniref:Unnamed protein product n=1 Tax=Candida boidinii TaxID=5477 RepID=A0A9W6SU24_CANBO|nr:unnamed protein product [[Candida] boidinii]GMF97783.1 unnamed protein product [[Candida] boidinii]